MADVCSERRHISGTRVIQTRVTYARALIVRLNGILAAYGTAPVERPQLKEGVPR